MSGECEDGVFLALKMQEDSYLPIEAQCVECEDGFSWLRYLPSLVFLLTKLGLPITKLPTLVFLFTKFGSQGVRRSLPVESSVR